ncbi:MAG: GIY-YIG nuclease family protein [Candidatus Peribacteraceae bacterium]|nr:GIY-YIG nuclease family protein [Candidatus Peribacteraceae bacterium]
MSRMSTKHFYRLQKILGLDSTLLPQKELASIVLTRKKMNQPKVMTKEISKRIIVEEMNRLGIIVQGKINKIHDGESFVYVIQQQGGDHHVKIGKSNDVERRLGELQQQSPYEYKILVKICATNETHAFNMERGLHERLKKYRVRGEWFTKDVIGIIHSVL